jgi:hypothetical protein
MKSLSDLLDREDLLKRLKMLRPDSRRLCLSVIICASLAFEL